MTRGLRRQQILSHFAPLFTETDHDLTMLFPCGWKSQVAARANSDAINPDAASLISISGTAWIIGINKSTLSREVDSGAVQSRVGKVVWAEELPTRMPTSI